MERKSNIELLRLLAFFLVCCIHITSIILVSNSYQNYSLTWWYGVIVKVISGPAIVMFILISGYLVGASQNTNKFSKTLKKILIPLLCYFPVLVYFDVAINTHSILQTFSNFLYYYGFFYHLWYIFIYIVLVYIFSKLTSYIKIPLKKILGIIIPLLLIVSISFTLNLGFKISIGFLSYFQNYFIYLFLMFALGIVIGKNDLKIKSMYAISGYLVSITLSVISYILLNNSDYTSAISFITCYSQLFNLIAVVSLFMIIKNMNFKSRFISKIGKLTYGAYIIHVVLIFYLQQRIYPYNTHATSKYFFVYDFLFVLFVYTMSLIIERIRLLVFSLFKSKNKYNPKVSIIIPVYNGEDYIEKAIKSALRQTYENLEIIVIDDGSVDNTENICKKYLDEIKYIKKTNGGVSSALNLGIKNMTGSYFSWLSHDDIYKRNKIKTQVNYLNKLDNKECVLYSDYAFITANGRRFGKVKRINHESVTKHQEICLLKGYLNGISLLIPKDIFIKVGLFDEKLKCTQDYDLWLKMIKKYKFYHIQKVLVYTRLHEKQTTNTSKNVVSEGEILWKKIIDSFTDKEKSEIYGSCENYYKELADFLKNTEYKKAYLYAKEKGEGK